MAAFKQEDTTTPECPFYVCEHLNKLSCELAKLNFPSIGEKTKFKRVYCCHTKGYKDCTLYKSLMNHYDTLYGGSSE